MIVVRPNVRDYVWLNLGLVILLTLSIAVEASGDLVSHVRKYEKASVPQSMQARIEQYDYLIDYFTSFSYFRPHYKVSGDFIRALIMAESGANRHAVSSKNAYGLGQIVLTTGQIAARELATSSTPFKYINKERLKHLTREDLFDPAINVLLTCYLIAKYNHRFNGRLDLVVSAWNAGENTSSLSEGKPAPYRETKELIGRVNGYYIFLLRQKGFIQ